MVEILLAGPCMMDANSHISPQKQVASKSFGIAAI